MDDCISVRFEENNNRSAAYDGDQEVGYCSYTLDGDVWVIEHTVVDPAYGGRPGPPSRGRCCHGSPGQPRQDPAHVFLRREPF